MIRTRFAPSPTGYMHIGNLRTALYTYLLAKNQPDGAFLLRIEDTDQTRYVEGAVDIIYKTLKDTGLNWDEGPDVGGPVGPYVQSERMAMHKEYALQLVEKGEAYYCFCEKERLEEVRTVQKASNMLIKYDGHCQHLTKEEIDRNLAQAVPYVIRQKLPTEGTTAFFDEVFGEIVVENSSLDDQILIKTDGMATYNFANVVDDHLMNITHVVRGNEYLSSAPKYNLLYKAFGWDVPKYIHVSPIMKNSTEKLSKRNGDASYQDLIVKGYISEAVMNYIALLGWGPHGENSDKEIFSLDELKQVFSVEGISKSPAIFDVQKLDYINGEYIKAMDAETFHEYALPWIKKGISGDVDTKFVASLLQSRVNVLCEIPEQLDFIDTFPDYDTQLFVHKKMKTDLINSLDSLKSLLPVVEALADDLFTVEGLHAAVFELIAKLGVKNGLILWPLRVAVTGKQFTPGGGIEMAVLLGKEQTIARLKTSIQKLA